MAVIEMASFVPFSEAHLTFLEQLSETLGVVVNTIVATMRTEELLQQSQGLTMELQSQSEELQSQRDELERTNQELEEQARSLKASEELLQQQQEELQQTNEELEEKAALLAEQNARIEQKNAEVEAARIELEDKAEQLALSSKYKSEFLANMSHELRTPLNSLLILAKLLSDNQEDTLTDKQVEFAKTIYNAGSDLLELINDILDLSKVEAGKMDVNPQPVTPAALADFVERNFRPVADQKLLEFGVIVDDELPATVVTDEQRLQQVIKNLLSNAFKFTESGSVTLTIAPAPSETRFGEPTLRNAEGVVMFQVTDTGIGIPDDKLKLIFEAFQQADGTTSRRFGGTGLGLSISREIARLLGGEIHVASEPARGSTFTLFLPPQAPEQESGARRPFRPSEVLSAPAFDPAVLLDHKPAVDDDREQIADGDRVVLIVEDDADFARTELAMARERGFKGIVAVRGDEGVALAHEYKPDAIILDMGLPVQDGWQVLEHLKRHPETRHIPVHIVSGGVQNGGVQDALRAGAVAVLEKPVEHSVLDEQYGKILEFVERGTRRLLIVDDDDAQRQAIVELIGSGDDVEITAVGSSEEALEALDSDDAVRLHGARPEAAEDERLPAAREGQDGRAVPRPAGDRLHRARPDPPRGDAAQQVRRDGDREGRAVARAPARRDRALPASRRVEAAGREAPHPRAAPLDGRGVQGEARADRRRRHAERLRAGGGARAPGHGRAVRRERQRGDRIARGRSVDRPRADGHHDAGARRLRGDAAHPPGAEVREAADHLADGEGDEGRPREVDRERRLRLHHEAGRHRPASLLDAGVAVQVGDPQHETPEGRLDLETLELQLLLEGVYRQYGFDFREYAVASLRRRVWRRVHAEGARRSRACSSGCCTTRA